MAYGEWKNIVWNLSGIHNWQGRDINAIRIKPWHQSVDVDYQIDYIYVSDATVTVTKPETMGDMSGSTSPWTFTGTTAFPAPGGIAAVSGQYMQHTIGPANLPGGFSGSVYNKVIVRLRTNDSGASSWLTAKDNNWLGQLLWDYEGRTNGPQFSSARSVYLREEGTIISSELPAPKADATYWVKVNRTAFDRVILGPAPIHHSVTGNSAPITAELPEIYVPNILGIEAFGLASIHSSGVANEDRFPSSGTGMIDQERINYSGSVDLGAVIIFGISERGVDGTVKVTHDAGAEFIFDKPSVLHSRSGKSGLFISPRGVDVGTADDGDLIFDSSAPDFLQVLKKGTNTIFPAADMDTPTKTTIYTNIQTPHADTKATALVRWSTLVPTSNLHQTAYSSSWGTPDSPDGYAVIPPYLNLDHINLANPSSTGVVPGYSLTARTYANTNDLFAPPTIDIEFTNGSPYKTPLVAWTLYRTKGTQ